jgi:23S rRNA pseudouridine2605 synthase
LNQQQLQNARAALWRQSRPIVTLDDASTWLDEIGLCLFLPRHAQLPAPAPSFVEAVLGAPSAAPPPGAIAQATEFATRLIAAGRAIPLNLLGTFSEQPDFLVTLDALPWVAAARGDRQWKTAPGGRSAPIVVRTWEALDQRGSLTALEIREQLGRELTEAAVLRALIELWTTLRAVPAYAHGEPTRWSLLKARCAPQLATAAGTALPTALSALLSIYLRSAVAATAEEAEIFLSPLTARSRIREVLHGMTAARQFHSLSLGSHTLLFIEGSLPDSIPETLPASAAEMSSEGATGIAASPLAPASPQQDRTRREAIRKYSRDEAPRGHRAGKPPSARPYDARPPRRDFRPAASDGGKPAPRPFQKREGGNSKPWQKRSAPFRSREDRPGGRPPFPRRDKPFERPRPGFGSKSGPKSFDRPRPPAPHEGGTRPPRRTTQTGPDAPTPKFLRPGPGMPRFDAADRASRPSRPAAPRSGPGRSGPGKFGPRKLGFSKPGFSKLGPRKPGFSKSGPPRSGPGKFGPAKFSAGPRKPGPRKPAKFGPAKSGPGQPRPSFGAAKRSSGSFAKRTRVGPGAKRTFRPGRPPGSGGPSRAGRPSPKSGRKNFPPTSAPRTPKPRKNRSQEESPE